MVEAGFVIDRIGTKPGYALALTVWCFAAICHAFARTTFGFGMDHYKALGDIETGYYITFIICAAACLVAWSVGAQNAES
jgi:ACS family hexuronate transporter-like MFS transporter